MKKFTVYMWKDGAEQEGDYLEVTAEDWKEAEEKASLECPNFDNYEARVEF